MKGNIIREYKKLPGASISQDGKRIDISLPSETDNSPGKLTMVFPGGPMLLNLIDIRSHEIPEAVANPGESERVLKINYCATGRCELRLESGECTYLTAGELAVDAGQALNTFYYPTSEYRGVEVIVSLADPIDGYGILGEVLSSPEEIYKICEDLEYPWICIAGETINQIYNAFRLYTEQYDNSELVLIKCLELIALLSKMDYSQDNIRRTYCTSSQAEIAKRTEEIIMSDLAVRHTAKKLAAEFGISETSLKNYFRNVYGCGYAQYQQAARMKEAAMLLEETDRKISDIGQSVGYATQAKFGAAFKGYYSVTPMEYRRRHRLGSGFCCKN